MGVYSYQFIQFSISTLVQELPTSPPNLKPIVTILRAGESLAQRLHRRTGRPADRQPGGQTDLQAYIYCMKPPSVLQASECFDNK